MKITSYLHQPSFEAISYKIRPFQPTKFYVQADSNPALGDASSLVSKFPWGTETFEMQTDNKGNQYVELFSPFETMAIYPLDYYLRYNTGKVDSNEGKNYHVDSANLVRKAAITARAQHRQPSYMPLKTGTTVGKILFIDGNVYDSGNEINEPTILVCQRHDCHLVNPNIVGIIITLDGNDRASHHPLQLRSGLNACALVLEPDTVNKLKELNGKNVELTCGNEQIAFRETDKIGKPMDTKFVDVPMLDYCDKILTSKDCTLNIIGTKAVNLRRMEELYEQGKIDAKIPKFIALPSGFLEPFMMDKFEQLGKTFKNVFTEMIENGTMTRIIKKMKENGVNTETVMIRSCFNTEDSKKYSAEGTYKSFQVDNNSRALSDRILKVANSKFYNDAKYFQSINHIPEEAVQPGVIIQNRIPPDYKLRIYTDDGHDNVRINVFSGELAVHSDAFHPHIFRYNKKTGELTYDSIQMTESFVTYDENENMIDITPIEEDLSGNEKLFEQLKRAVKNALIIEKEFGAPQDIEGGIKDDDIYFWQSKNIVKDSEL